MSKERARRRAERLAVAERERVVRARKVARRLRRRQLVRILTPTLRRRRVGRIVRRSRADRAAIVGMTIIAAGAIWFLVRDPALRIVLGILLVLALPVAVVMAFGRRT